MDYSEKSQLIWSTTLNILNNNHVEIIIYFMNIGYTFHTRLDSLKINYSMYQETVLSKKNITF